MLRGWNTAGDKLKGGDGAERVRAAVNALSMICQELDCQDLNTSFGVCKRVPEKKGLWLVDCTAMWVLHVLEVMQWWPQLAITVAESFAILITNFKPFETKMTRAWLASLSSHPNYTRVGTWLIHFGG